MGNCAIKPKVLKDSDEDLIPVERETSAHPVHNKDTAPVKSSNIAPNAAEEVAAAVAAVRRSEKGKDILIEDDEEDHSKRQSLSLLFHEDKGIKKEITGLSPAKPEMNNKTGVVSSEVSKPDTSNVKAPEIFDVETRNDLEVKIPNDSPVKTPETPKAKEAEDQEVDFSENWEVKFPEELEAKKTSEVVKVSEDLKHPPVSMPTVPELSEVKVTKESDVPKDLEDKNVPESPKVKTDEVKVAESELLKVSEVKSPEDLEIKVPEVFEVKTPETTSSVNVTDDSKVKTDEGATNVKIVEETEASEFVDAPEKIDKPEAQVDENIKVTKDKEIALPNTEEGEKGASSEKKVKESSVSDLGNK
ncbi:unnamed protein product [Microthlaspi erraticum]|uniref:Uncharacterized protein n=1 Tax=Microthlaspi erraticum TaxID=1685480 RepID=A0A6D2J4D4_9BRAS|nr:unnamed protein product [Microthlaspi erraticum]